jgi:hypothetical protein
MNLNSPFDFFERPLQLFKYTFHDEFIFCRMMGMAVVIAEAWREETDLGQSLEACIF